MTPDDRKAARERCEKENDKMRPYCLDAGWVRDICGDLDGEALVRYALALEAEVEEYKKAVEKHNRKMDSVPSWVSPPKTASEGLRFLAYWFDLLYGDAGTGKDAVQEDLRRWAGQIDADEGLMRQAAGYLGSMASGEPLRYPPVCDCDGCEGLRKLRPALRARLGEEPRGKEAEDGEAT